MLKSLAEKKPTFFSGILKSKAFLHYPFTSKPETNIAEFYKQPSAAAFREALKLFTSGASLCTQQGDSLSAGKYLDLGSIYATQVFRYHPYIFDEALQGSMALMEKIMLYRALFTNGIKHPLLAEILNQEEIRDYVFNKEVENALAPENSEIYIQHHVDRLWTAYFVTGNPIFMKKMIHFMNEDANLFHLAEDVSHSKISMSQALTEIQKTFGIETDLAIERLLINQHIIYTFRMNGKKYQVS